MSVPLVSKTAIKDSIMELLKKRQSLAHRLGCVWGGIALALGLSGLAMAADPVSTPSYTGMIIERNVEIVTRDGTTLRGDVFRPDTDEALPVIMSMTAYQKDMPWRPWEGIDALSTENQNWETPNPDRWVPYGYVIVRVDTRGTGQSPGIFEPLSAREAEDFYDAIEWAGDQSWSNGNVGLSGISYMAINQWRVASLQPPSLRAIIPWEGFSDQYRDGVFQGGILSYAFLVNWYNGVMYDNILRGWDNNDPDAFGNSFLFELMRHRLDGPFWEARRPIWEDLTVPVLSAGNWTGFYGAQHFRGNTEGYKLAASEHRYLRIHTGGHQDAFYSEEGFQTQLAFFDHWLKGHDTGLLDEPPVRLAIRRSVADPADFEWRSENEWPIARTDYQRLHLTSDGGLSPSAPGRTGRVDYMSPAIDQHDEIIPAGMATFVSEPFEAETEITGEIMAGLWVSTSRDDMNIHADVYIVHPDGTEERLTRGRLRASQRRLDPEMSTPSRPWLAHDRIEPLVAGEVYPVEFEIWPTSMIFSPGSRVKLVIASGAYHTRTWDRQEPEATNTIHVGG
ncbi:CocE/NonD family hydrolase, partial [Maricaulis maris]|uniref:CocE/NonD family hydrolase n=1 Tax=Maricaulis maris TaxID=74318 RepID=UPI0014755AC7